MHSVATTLQETILVPSLPDLYFPASEKKLRQGPGDEASKKPLVGL